MAVGMDRRVEYMNSTPHHSKLRVTITLASALFIAGQDVTGKMEMECRGDNDVGIGLIMVELFAVQELNSRDHSATSTFLHIRRFFQGPGLPPSNAVVPHPTPGQKPLPPGHFPARRGITTFFFRFPLPLSSPSAVSFASGLARVRYEVRASVSVAHRGEKRVVTSTADADVVQCMDMDGVVSEHVSVGENGKVYVQGRVLGGRLVSGQQACVELHVKNNSQKKIKGLLLTLTRALYLQDTTTSPPPLQLNDTLVSQNFHGPNFTISPGAEGIATLVFDVPNAARVVKGGPREGAVSGALTPSLFELRCILSIYIGMGIGSKDVLFEIPVQLSHPATLTPRTEVPVSPRGMSPPNAYLAHSPGPGSSGSSPARQYDSSPHAYTARPLLSSPPPQSYGPSPAPYSSPAPYYVSSTPYPQQHIWSPPPPNIPYFVSAADLQRQYYIPPLHAPLIPFAHPARPSSAGALTMPPTRLPGVGVAEPDELPGVGAVTHAYPPPQSQHHSPREVEDLAHERPLPQSGSHPEGREDARGSVVEEGKGARASRIAQHLRASTRARSASPTAHRFTVSMPAPTGSFQPVPNASRKTPLALYATSSHNPAALPVLSPRPVRSPRHSTSGAADTGVNRTTRSGDVDLLEHMVASAPSEEELSAAEMLQSLEKDKDQDKTLPPPPVPTGKDRREIVPHVRNVFAPQLDQSGDGTAATQKSVLRPSPMAQRLEAGTTEVHGKHEVDVGERLLKPVASGLDALERRLLYEVGTRKPNMLERPTILPLSTSTAASGVPTPVHYDSEISTFAIASHGSSEHEAHATSSPRGMSPSPPKEAKDLRALGIDNTHPGPRKTSTARDNNKELARIREGKIRQEKALKLRKEAKGRVADWLEGVSDVPSDKERTDIPVPPLKRTNDLESVVINNAAEISVDALPERPHCAASPSSENLPQRVEEFQIPNASFPPFSQDVERHSRNAKQEPFDVKQMSSKHETLPRLTQLIPAPPPLPKSPRLKMIDTVVSPRLNPIPETFLKDDSQPPVVDTAPSSDKLTNRLPKLLSSPVVPETKYDVRSARGGKGGIATSVAAIWTTLANENSDAMPTKPPPKVDVAPVRRPAFLEVGKAKPSSTSAEGPANHSLNPAAATNKITSPSEQTRPRNMIKAASIPAAMVPSHAKPHISSTASLSRPVAGLVKNTPPTLSPTLSETRNALSPKARVTQGELAIGKARLRDLIKKYQQGTS